MENVVSYLEAKWKKLTGFNKNEDVKAQCWGEIIEQYSRRGRFYHNLKHIANLFHLFDEQASLAQNPALVGFAIFYHDLVYDTLRNDNEERSALKAKEHLTLLNLKPSFIENVVALILATKAHSVDTSTPVQNDVAFFLDLDLAVLGEDWKDYEYYSNNIRNEFLQYPDPIFKSGRKNALYQLLQKETIYYTPYFQRKLESRARHNMQREISLL
jgi:predicted metal-dependent HD superfamily phosphohydrolase